MGRPFSFLLLFY
uniref:Uncharacterized protein n=1 Tax=Anguilla anguilla TaxID=7936 RepID=A0A0E9T4Q3_ANGAN